MKILVTGAGGFVGKNLCANLNNIKNGRDRTRPAIKIDGIFEYDVDGTKEQLENYCENADFVFNLAGVNRPENPEEFKKVNCDFLSVLLAALKKYKNRCPVMLSSSLRAGYTKQRLSDYGKSKKDAEKLLFDYGKETGAKVLIYRFPNIFGKWCRPDYNSAVATFCHNIANGLPIVINDRKTELQMLYIDDLIAEMLDALEGKEHRCGFDGLKVLPDNSGRYCHVPVTHFVTLGEIADLLDVFKRQPETLLMPEIRENSFAGKLYATYLSYLPKEKVVFPLKMNIDSRGSFTELLKTEKCGQFSVNISKPGITKGEHWHNSKWELFIVVSGHARIRERRIGTDEVFEFEVSGDNMQAVHMLPGYTHNITNLSKTENLVTLMWASERFDKDRPDTFYEKVGEDRL